MMSIFLNNVQPQNTLGHKRSKGMMLSNKANPEKLTMIQLFLTLLTIFQKLTNGKMIFSMENPLLNTQSVWKPVILMRFISTDDEYFFDQSSTSKYCHIRSISQDDTIISDVILQFSKLDDWKNFLLLLSQLVL